MTQDEALKILKMGKNVFLTGPAGSGKTYVLNAYTAYLQDRGVDVAITASTGIAATHIGGVTIHSWAGIGIKDFLSEYDIDAMEQKQYLWKRFEKVQVLVIDEVSMLKDATLDMVDRVCKTFKRSAEPFGGLQVVISGDFFQLPPIEKGNRAVRKQETLRIDMDDTYSYESQTEETVFPTPFAFLSRAWREAKLHVCYLEEQYRQGNDNLLTILNEIRSGEISEGLAEDINARIVKEEKDMTRLFTHNMNVDEHNMKRLQKVKGDEKVYEMTTKGKPNMVDALIRGCLAPRTLRVRVGARVMFVKNNPVAGYVNGTTGEITGFRDGHPVVETSDGREFTAQPQTWAIEENGNVLGEVAQVPLRLAWAITVHKSQGMTLDEALIDLSKAFVPGQGYVALSRVRSMEGLHLVGINQQAFQIHPRVLEFDKNLKDHSSISVSRLEKTPSTNIDTYHKEFLIKIGGSEKPTKKKKKKEIGTPKSTYEKTKDLVLKKKSIKDMATERDISEGTIIEHIEKLLKEKMIGKKDITHIPYIKSVAKSFKTMKTIQLKTIYEKHKGKFDYQEVRIARLFSE